MIGRSKLFFLVKNEIGRCGGWSVCIRRVWGTWANDNFVNEFIKDIIQNSDINNIKWQFDNKGIGSDQNLLKRKIKEALKSTEGRNIIESLTSSGTAEANRVKGYFYRINDDGILALNNKAVDDFIDGKFDTIFKF